MLSLIAFESATLQWRFSGELSLLSLIVPCVTGQFQSQWEGWTYGKRGREKRSRCRVHCIIGDEKRGGTETSVAFFVTAATFIVA